MTTNLRAWAGDRLGITVMPAGSLTGLSAPDLVGVGLRRNPRRVQLLVSRLLGKHLPTDPRLVRGAGLLLGRFAARLLTDVEDPALVRWARDLQDALDDPAAAGRFWTTCREQLAAAQAGPEQPPVVLGMCETAVALGYAVAEALPGSDYLQTTRRPTAVPTIGGFEEEHSHSTSHLLAPRDQSLLLDTADGTRPLVLVDDELSTGQTLLNTIGALHALAPRKRYVVLTLVDLRVYADVKRAQALESRLGIRIDVVALAKGRVKVPADLPERAAALLQELPTTPDTAAQATPAGALPEPVRVDLAGPADGRHGITAGQRAGLQAAMQAAAGDLRVAAGEEVLVLGTEEFMAAPLLLGTALCEQVPDARVRFSTTTRSPAAAVDEDGYPLRSVIGFAAPALDGDPDLPGRFAYNVARPKPWDRVVLVVDTAQAGPRLTDGDPAAGLPGLVPVLTRCARRVDVVHVAEPA